MNIELQKTANICLSIYKLFNVCLLMEYEKIRKKDLIILSVAGCVLWI